MEIIIINENVFLKVSFPSFYTEKIKQNNGFATTRDKENKRNEKVGNFVINYL